MCGIFGYTGCQQAAPMLLDGLDRLEYRGYDSAGLSVSDGQELRVVKAQGRLKVLSEKTDGGRTLPGTSGLGHTRWATHGKPSDINSHPHLSENSRIAIVHNGIIENYAPLKEMLENRGRHFESETDTEVVAQLIDYYYEGNLLEAVARTVRELTGSYALGVMCADDPDTLIAVRSHAPLIVAYADGGNMFASDIMAFLKYTKNVTYLADDELAAVKKDSVTFYTPFLDKIEKPVVTVDWDISLADKGGYEHYMLKEIMEQPEALRRTIAPLMDGERGKIDLGVSLPLDYVNSLSRIYIVACGSAYHAGVVAKNNIEKLARIPCEAMLASEFRYCDPIADSSTLAIFLSQSGETADTLEALREAKRRSARTLSVVNVAGSSIAMESDDVIYTLAGPEIAVATTKAYSTQIAVSCLIALHLADCRGTVSKQERESIISELTELPEKVEKILSEKSEIQYHAYQYFSNEDIFFIGRGNDFALSLEGSLKLKEISYIHSDAYAAGELKHGTISLVEDGTLVVAVATCLGLAQKTASNAQQVMARGARVLTVTTESARAILEPCSSVVICVPDAHETLLPLHAILPLQLFAYYMALYRGCDIDKPRNLAKSVTVE